MAERLAEPGFAPVPGLFSKSEVLRLLETLGPVAGAGRRGFLAVPAISGLARSARVLELVRSRLGAEPRAVRAIYFDKAPGANWLVAWHQDLTLAVRAHAQVPGFGPWSVKSGVPHVQPPIELLERMLTVRLHLDGCDESNGALRVLPGTHRLGRLTAEQIAELRREVAEVVCRGSAGDVLLIRPLLLHASARSQGHGHRRVLHIEYAGFNLPAPLEWHEAS
jgi:ectoine hydroxylase-related dioxygenase (phytanoyl-CoA dioxygenase family)